MEPKRFSLCDGCPDMAVCLGKCQCEAEEQDLSARTRSLGVPEILEEMARTFRERNAIYGDNWNMVGRMMVVMFPHGVQLQTTEDYDLWHLFELMIVKLSRFAVAGLGHKDSIHDLAVYAAMVEGILNQRKEPLNVIRRRS